MVVENVRGAQAWVGRAKANYGSFYLWGDIGMVGKRVVARPKFGEGVSPAWARKNSGGSWFAIQSNGTVVDRNDPRYANNPVKVQGLDWSKHGTEGYKAQGFNVTAAQRFRENKGLKLPGNNSPRRWEDQDVQRLCDAGRKGVGIGSASWQDKESRHPNDPRNFYSSSDSRKAASAQIAKIPFPLSQYIARAYKP